MYSKKVLRQQYGEMYSTYHKYGYRKNTCRRLHLIDAYTVCIYVLLYLVQFFELLMFPALSSHHSISECATPQELNTCADKLIATSSVHPQQLPRPDDWQPRNSFDV